MWIDSPEIMELLRGIVCHVSPDASQHPDLLQEALLHLWGTEQQFPQNTLSWHLQSCYFHLKNLTRKGKSIDSFRHRTERENTPLPENSEGSEDTGPALIDSRTDVLSQVAADEGWALLARTLPKFDFEILQELAAGSGVRQVAVRFRVSHTQISRRRRQIARRALDLGLGGDLYN